jgi:hypothetical protein
MTENRLDAERVVHFRRASLTPPNPALPSGVYSANARLRFPARKLKKWTFFRSRIMTSLTVGMPGTFEEQMEGQVLRRLGGRVRDLRILLRHNGLILQGRSGTYHAKQLAQHAAMELTGLPVLANDIEVR